MSNHIKGNIQKGTGTVCETDGAKKKKGFVGKIESKATWWKGKYEKYIMAHRPVTVIRK